MREVELIYGGVNPRKVGELEAFRERSALYSEIHKKLVYRTWSLGEGEDAVVFLPGGMAHGEVWFPQMLDLRGTRRSIAFSLPECKSLDDAADGVLYTLGQMGVRRAVIVGYSLGGLIAQIMIRKQPSMIAGAALVLTGAPVRDLPDEICARWLLRRKQKLQTQLLNFNNATRMAMAEHVFRSNCPEELEIPMDFWRAFIEDSYCNHIYLKQYVNLNYVAQPALYKERPFAPGDTASWKGEMTILYSEDDKLYSKEYPYLFALYPDAKHVHLGDGGQFAMLVHRELLSREIEELADACLQ